MAMIAARITLAAAAHRLTDEGEVGLIRKLAEYPRLIESAAQQLEPHRLAFYLYDLASTFHGHWNRGTETTSYGLLRVNDRRVDLCQTRGWCRL